jgi:two-component system C4-dicarboxylate transport sensor histidine kinase DctB
LPDIVAPASDPSRVGQAIRDARRSIGAPSYVYLAGTPHLQIEVPVGFRNWRLTYFATLEDVRVRVNALLSLIIMVLALLTALAFYLISRRTRAESKRIQRESEELRVLNRRLSTEIAARKRMEANLKEAEQSLEQASKLAALGQMSAAVSHELNQPLAAMKTYLAGARLLLTRRRPDEALSSFQRIDDLIDRMGSITRQLKSYARKGDVDIEPVDLRDSVRAALAMMAPQLGKMAVNIVTTLPSEPAVVEADPLRIEQIIVNLLRNALDAVRNRDDKEINILLFHVAG